MMRQSHLTAWQAYAPWPKRSQIEQDLRLSRGVASSDADAAKKEDGVDIPRFLGRQNNQ